MNKIVLKPIGIIHTPYKELNCIPRQGKYDKNRGYIEIFPEYEQGLKDLEGFSHIILLWYFHKSDIVNLLGKPPGEKNYHGIFAIRSPHRPNHLGLSNVELVKIHKNILTIKKFDILDGTPLLDIKPYVKEIDEIKNARFGWIGRHTK